MQLRSEQIVKVYKDRMVVKGVDLHVKSGEIVGLLGPNGAGKTTSFYMMVGFISPTKGRVFIDGEDVTALPMYERARHGLGYLAQEPTIFKGLTVEENLLAVLERILDDKQEQKRRVDALLNEFGLTKLARQKAWTLSGGAELSDSQRTLVADTIIYDGEHNYSTASGSRPLLSGTSEQGTFAIIADKVQADNEGRQITLDGKVQGWVVSPQLNDAEINDKF